MIHLAEFPNAEEINIDFSEMQFAFPETIYHVSVRPHFDRLVVTINGDEQTIPLADSQRLTEELIKGHTVEIRLDVALPGQPEFFEVRVTWVGVPLRGASEAQTVRLLEDSVYRITGAPPFRGLIGEESDALSAGLLGFLERREGSLAVTQVTFLSTTRIDCPGELLSQWTAHNWYG